MESISFIWGYGLLDFSLDLWIWTLTLGISSLAGPQRTKKGSQYQDRMRLAVVVLSPFPEMCCKK